MVQLQPHDDDDGWVDMDLVGEDDLDLPSHSLDGDVRVVEDLADLVAGVNLNFLFLTFILTIITCVSQQEIWYVHKCNIFQLTIVKNVHKTKLGDRKFLEKS